MTEELSQTLRNVMKGTRCDIDLEHCEMHLVPPDKGDVVRIALPTEKKQSEPALTYWGNGICLLEPDNGKMRRIAPWEPGLKYSLLFQPDGAILYSDELIKRSYLIKTRSFIYPGYYTRTQGQGPFDLFASPDHQLLAVVNRSEGQIVVVHLGECKEIARKTFDAFAGPAGISVAIDSHAERLWIAGLDHKQVLTWDFKRDQVNHLEGPWKQPSYILGQDGHLWILDAGDNLVLHKVNQLDGTVQLEVSLKGKSYAATTDTPSDICHISADGLWIAVLSQVSLPDPLTPKVSLIHTQSLQISAFEPSQRSWPFMFAEAANNTAIKSLGANEALNQATPEDELAVTVRSLLVNYGLSLDKFASKMTVLKALPSAPTELHPHTNLAVLEQIKSQLKKECGREVPDKLQTPQELELLVHAEQITQLLKQHKKLDVVLYGIFGDLTIQLSLDQEEYTLMEGSSIEEVLAALLGRKTDTVEKIATEKVTALKMGWTGLADPLNCRVLQLDPAGQLRWSLDTNWVGAYRPIAAQFISDEQFVILDGEQNEVSCWNHRGKQEWSLEKPEYNWNRMYTLTKADDLQVLLISSEDGKAIQFDTAGNTVCDFSDAEFEADGILDITRAPASHFWILQNQGNILFYSHFNGVQRKLKVPGYPSVLALDPTEQTLAIFDSQVQKLWLWNLSEDAPTSIDIKVKSPRYRIQQPLGIQWRSPNEVIIHDPFRLMMVDIKSGTLTHQLLMQDLQIESGQKNQAPASVFEAKTQQNLNMRGGHRTSLREMLSRVPMFQNAPERFIQELMGHVKTRLYNKGDAIVTKGEKGDEMYFMRQGQVEVLDGNQRKVVAKMGPGDVFGEVALMLGVRRNATVRAGSYSEVFCLGQAGLDALLPTYPDVKERLLQLAHERQMQEQLRSEGDRERIQARLNELQKKRSPKSAPKSAILSSKVQAEGPLTPLNLWVRHQRSKQLAKVNREGQVKTLLQLKAPLIQPVQALETPNGRWVLDMGLNSLVLFDMDTNQVRKSVDHWETTALNQPRSMTETPDGAIWVANTGRGELLLLSNHGELLEHRSMGKAPAYISTLDNGHLLVADMRMHTVTEITPEGKEVWCYGTPRRFGRSENMLFAPEFAQRLANGNTLIADTGNSRVIEVDRDQRIVWALVSGTDVSLPRPTRALRLEDGHTLVEHSNFFRWLEVTPELDKVWIYSLPIQGFSNPS